MYRGSGPFQIPQAMTTEHISQVRGAFVNAARQARDAGFDGVEIHGANGYLLDEFLTDYLNTRTDEYGGSIANRVRLAAEVCHDVASAVGGDIAVGIRISQGKVSDNHHRWAGKEDDAATIFGTLADTGIDYIHTTEYRALAPAFAETGKSLAQLAKQYSRLSIIANGHLDDPRDAAAIIESGAADVVALAKPALANRDWPHRVRLRPTVIARRAHGCIRRPSPTSKTGKSSARTTEECAVRDDIVSGIRLRRLLADRSRRLTALNAKAPRRQPNPIGTDTCSPVARSFTPIVPDSISRSPATSAMRAPDRSAARIAPLSPRSP